MKLLKTLLIFAIISVLPFSTQAQQKNSATKVNASKIIRMSNSVITLNNEAIQTLESYRNVISTAENNLRRVKSNPNITPSFVNYKIYTLNQTMNTEYTQASKAAPSFDEKSLLVQAVTDANKNMSSMVSKCEALSNYFSNKEYLTDTDYSKYATLEDSTLYYINAAEASWRIASQLAATAGDKAELLLLKDSKIAAFVIPMKTDLIALKNIFSQIADQESDLSLLENEITTLKASIKTNEDISTKDIKKLSDIYYKEVYTTFYRQCNNATESLDKLTKMLAEGEKDGDRLSSFFRSAQSHYSQAIEQYNTFVKQ